MTIFHKPLLAGLLIGLLLFVTIGCSNNGSGGNQSTAPGNPSSETSNPGSETSTSEDLPENVVFATNAQGSAWFVYGATIAELMRPVMEGTALDVVPFAGGVGNAQMLDEDKADIALSFSLTTKWAYDGNIAYDKNYPNLRVLAGALDHYYVILVTTQSFVDKYDVTSLQDVADRKIPIRIYTATKGNLAEFAAQQVLDAYGLDYDKIKEFGGKVELTPPEAVQSAFQNGDADMFINVMPKGHPAVQEISVRTPITFLPFENEIVEKLKAVGYESKTFPGGVFKGVDEDVNTVGFSTMLITNEDFNEEAAYLITKTIVENKEKLADGHVALQDFDVEKAFLPENLPVQLHPGAERYAKEAGLLK